MRDTINILVTGTENYQSRAKIEKFIFALVKRYDGVVNIATRGRKYGADIIIENFLTSIDKPFYRFSVYHNKRTCLDIESVTLFNKRFNVSNYIVRDKRAMKWSDATFYFMRNNNEDEKEFKLFEQLDNNSKITLIKK